SRPFALSRAQLHRIADRHLGVGCDQILVVERPHTPGADFRYRIFNADGGEVEQCGNGARCFVRYVHERGLTGKREISVETLGGNAGDMQVRDRHRIALRVWERGAGETLSCGTGACAAVVGGVAQRLLDSPVRVETRGGALTIAWAGGDNAVVMKGPAETVYD